MRNTQINAEYSKINGTFVARPGVGGIKVDVPEADFTVSVTFVEKSPETISREITGDDKQIKRVLCLALRKIDRTNSGCADAVIQYRSLR